MVEIRMRMINLKLRSDGNSVDCLKKRWGCNDCQIKKTAMKLTDSSAGLRVSEMCKKLGIPDNGRSSCVCFMNWNNSMVKKKRILKQWSKSVCE